jgi:hypothetical protein
MLFVDRDQAIRARAGPQRSRQFEQQAAQAQGSLCLIVAVIPARGRGIGEHVSAQWHSPDGPG